ncbi:hypothetical protein TTHERM_00423410 (macronuclear) [Tetrahymena thermophila SB210]|uniref:EGF-like domain-containing protein n=1 Tax=Tetrahymena thermophila (strain SB210) TaxID=312017 RepID=Q23AM0_TETTS|nr:hypothetical protein TTHERM_00423410 [Tetrahymena thermophila SB210]EAR93472.3 hypothetical protein TTHERM_00423410 [Tetrahymena thermophila SB210]|eukprot:XP_001013717.3 hypothetical protein TTHERM_00423410 [Tetrahymena thermophila SB210]
MTSGQTGYLQTLQYPQAAKSCPTPQIQIQKIGEFYYYICFDQSNKYFGQSQSFQDLFTTPTIIFGDYLSNENTHIVYDSNIYMNGTFYVIEISFSPSTNIVLVNMEYNLYLIEDYLTKVQTADQSFQDISSVKLNNPSHIDNILISDAINFQNITIIIAYDYLITAFRYFNVQNLTELQSTGETLPFIDYKTFLQHENIIFIGTSQYTLTYISSLNKVNITKSSNALQNSFTLPYFHIIYYAFSYSFTYQVFQGSTQKLVNIQQLLNHTCPPQFVPDNSNTNCVCRPNSTSQNQSCPCNPGYIDVNGDCQQCPSNCNVCTSQAICSQCSQSYYLTVQQTCVSGCPQTFIPDSTSKRCICGANRKLQNQSCPCNTGYIDVNGDCQQCLSNCDVCTSQAVCSQCSQSYYLTVQQTCVSGCPQTFIPDSTSKRCICGANRTLQNQSCPCNTGYIDVNGDCQQCLSNCDVCTSQAVCSQCSQSYYLTVQQTCVSGCPQTFIPDSTSKRCICGANRTLQNQSCPCNTGYIDVNGDCQQCLSNCDICTSQAICSQCSQSYYLTVQQTCVSRCPQTFIPDSTQKICICGANRTLQNQSCPCNTGYIDVNGDCQQCPSNCDVCTSQAVCSQCSQSYYLTVQQTCVSGCPQTFIPDSTSKRCICGANRTLQNQSCPCNTGYIDVNGDCQQCLSNCDVCTSQAVCSQCTQSYYLTVQQTCVSGCPQTFIPDSTSKRCICGANRTLQNQSCPCNTGYIDVNGDCQQCLSNCDVCTSQAVCSQCSQSYYLTVQQTCVSGCPQTFIPDSTSKICICGTNRTLKNQSCPCNTGYIDVNGDCQQCPSNCDVCTSQAVCSQCSQSYYLNVQQTCVSRCPQTFIPDSTQKICICGANRTLQNQSCPCNTGYIEDAHGDCLQCPSNCDVCTSQAICSLCSQSYYLTVQQTCVSSCPQTFIPDSTSKICICGANRTLQNQSCPCNTGYIDVNGDCQQCPSNCDVCTSQAVCSQCSQSYYLTVQQTCVSGCPQTFIPDSTSKRCICGANRTLQNQSCPCNTGYIDVNGDCQQCPSNCDVCTSQAICSQCSQSYYLTVQQTCVSGCPQTFIPDSTSKRCICGTNRTLKNQSCPCNTGYIEDVHGDCQQCPSNCDVCTSQAICSQCSQSYYLNQQQICVSGCPQTFIPDSTSKKCVCDLNRTQQKIKKTEFANNFNNITILAHKKVVPFV